MNCVTSEFAQEFQIYTGSLLLRYFYPLSFAILKILKFMFSFHNYLSSIFEISVKQKQSRHRFQYWTMYLCKMYFPFYHHPTPPYQSSVSQNFLLLPLSALKIYWIMIIRSVPLCNLGVNVSRKREFFFLILNFNYKFHILFLTSSF